MTTQTTTPPAPRPLGAGLRPLGGGLRPLARPSAPGAAPPPRAAAPAPAEAAPAPAETASAPPAPAPRRAAPKAAQSTAAAPATPPVEAAETAPAAKPARKAAAPWADGAYRPRVEVKLPELGSRMTLETTKELWHRFILAHASELGLNPDSEPTKEFTQGLMMILINFLFGSEVNSEGKLPLPPASVEGLVQNGGLARLFDVRLRSDIAFGIERVTDRVFPNPRKDVAPGTLIRIRDRAHVKLTYLSQAGLSESGRKVELEPGAPPTFVADAAQPAAEEAPPAPAEPEGAEEQAAA